MWLKENNRFKYLLGAIPVGLMFTLLCVLGLATGLEFNNYQKNNKWDWENWSAVMLGGAIGQILQIIAILFLR